MKGDMSYMNSLTEAFSKLPGIEKVIVNPATGSALFIHNIDAGKITRYARSKALFALSHSRPYPSNMHERVTETFKSLDRHVEGFTEGEMDISGVSFVVLIAAGIYQISKGNFTALPWYAAFWYALNIFLKSSPGKGGEIAPQV
jgi:Heavy metal associated domain 2